MEKKNGFIATSLIYSFFLVFLSVLLATLNGYLTNDRIMSRYNKSIKETLDKKALIPMIYSPENCFLQLQNTTDKHLLEEGACFSIFNNHSNLIPTDNTKYDTSTNNYNCTITLSNNDYVSTPITTMNLKEWGEGTYDVTCAIRNTDIDSRYIYSTTTTVRVVENLISAEESDGE